MASKTTHLIVSIDERDWMKAEEKIKKIGPKKCYVMIVKIDDTYLEGHEGLCEDAIYVQKTHDVYKFGKKLGIPKIANLGHTTDIDLHKLITQLQVQILIGGTKNIIISQDEMLKDILKTIKSRLDESINIEYI